MSTPTRRMRVNKLTSTWTSRRHSTERWRTSIERQVKRRETHVGVSEHSHDVVVVVVREQERNCDPKPRQWVTSHGVRAGMKNGGREHHFFSYWPRIPTLTRVLPYRHLRYSLSPLAHSITTTTASSTRRLVKYTAGNVGFHVRNLSILTVTIASISIQMAHYQLLSKILGWMLKWASKQRYAFIINCLHHKPQCFYISGINELANTTR